MPAQARQGQGKCEFKHGRFVHNVTELQNGTANKGQERRKNKFKQDRTGGWHHPSGGLCAY
jgi:hypothetical protein